MAEQRALKMLCGMDGMGLAQKKRAARRPPKLVKQFGMDPRLKAEDSFARARVPELSATRLIAQLHHASHSAHSAHVWHGWGA